jgi:hypothetical protein
MALAVVERKGELSEAAEAAVADDLKRRFQQLAVGKPTPERLSEAWRQFGVWDEATALSGPGALNYRRLAETVATGERIRNPSSRFALTTLIKARTVGLNGREGSLLRGVREEEMPQVRDFCERMIEMVENPRALILDESGD